jgi:hypothetical protein
MSVPRLGQSIQQPPDILPDRAYLPLFIPLSAAHMLPRPVLNTLQLGSRLLALHLAGPIVIDDRQAPAPLRCHLLGPLRIIHPQVPLVFDHCVAKSPVRQLRPVHWLNWWVQQ